jgi:hypothetical protein
MIRRRARVAGMVGLFALVLLQAASVAAAPHLQLVGESSLGYTDNAQAVARGQGDAGGVETRSVFWMVSPGVVLALESPRRLQRLAYRYEHDFYFNTTDSSSSSNRLDYRGFFELSRYVNLVLGSNVTEADRFNAVTFAAPGAGAIGALPTGTGSFLQVAADESFSFDVAQAWRAWHSGSLVLERPIFGTEAPGTSGVGARVGVERSFFADAVGAEGRADYSAVSGSLRPDGTPAGIQRQLSAGGVALWRRDWAREWTSSVEAGALRVQRLNAQRGFWTPTAAAAVSYATERGDAQLAYTHSISTNVLLGQSLLVDEVRLRAGLPLTSQGELALAMTCGYQRGRLLDEEGRLATRVRVILADLSLGWQVTNSLQLGIRYEHIQQKSGADAPPLPLSFVQNNVLLGAMFKFPPERDMPRPYRAPRRVDRSDELREGFRATAEGSRGSGNGAP